MPEQRKAETDAPGRGRMVLLLIAGLPATMILAATWLWFYVASGDIDLVDMLGTANHGELIAPPRSLSELQFVDAADNRVSPTDQGSGVWTILVPTPTHCDRDCVQLLHYTHQIRTAMGKYTNRIQRISLSFDEAQVSALQGELATEHPQLKFLYTSAARWNQLMAGIESRNDGPGYYLVDPQGWIMMWYQAEADGKDVMADLKFLLKNSNG
jgi:cytochrome oxidase Cu insertion factor (SCO1/SenC/PrrC family)